MPDLAEQVMGQINSQGTPAPAPTDGTPPVAATPPASGLPGGGGGIASPPAAAAAAPAAASPAGGAAAASAQYTSLLDAARQYGYTQIPEGMNEHQLLQHLIGQARANEQMRQMAGYGQEFLRHRDQFSQWMADRQAKEKASVEQQKKWWNPPEFNPAWRTQVYRDPQTQELRVLPTVPPGVADKYQQWQQFERESLDRLLQDPIGTLKPGLEQLVSEIAGQMMQQQTTAFQDQNFTQQFLQQNANRIYAQSGQMSQWGQRFKAHVDSLVSMGMRGDQQIAQQALALTDREYLAAEVQKLRGGQAVQQTGQQQKETFLQQAAARTATPGQTTGNLPAQPQTNGQPALAQNPGLSLAQRMLQGMRANGVTDQAIQQTLSRPAG